MTLRQQYDAWCAEPDEAHTSAEWLDLAWAIETEASEGVEDGMTRDTQYAYLDLARDCRARVRLLRGAGS